MCIRGEELQDVQLGLDWSLQGLFCFVCTYFIVYRPFQKYHPVLNLHSLC